MRRREGEREGGSTLGFSHELLCLLSIIGSGAGCPPFSIGLTRRFSHCHLLPLYSKRSLLSRGHYGPQDPVHCPHQMAGNERLVSALRHLQLFVGQSP